jgi:adenylate kinase
MRKNVAVFIFGTPGAGKGTQANLLEWTKGFYHFDSGKELRAILNDPTSQDDPLIRREKEFNNKGLLNTPSWVLGIFKYEAEKIAKAGMSLVYSGSPRTMYEAFGGTSADSGQEGDVVGLVPFLENLYGKENVYAVFLKVDPEVAMNRNKIRRTCTVCTNPVLGDAQVTVCPICEGELKIRIDDNPETYKTRYSEYTTRTMPILDALKKRGYTIAEFDGAQKPPAIYAQILKHLGY